MKIYYCVEKTNKVALSAGPLPEVWGNITGMADISDGAAADLTWAGYPDHGFVTRETAVQLGISQESLNAAEAAFAAKSGIENAEKAKQLLVETDWCENLSVRNVNVIPHLTNTAEFDEYRLILRSIVVNQTSTVEQWPDKPQAVWAS